jgi:cytochrome c553
MAETPSSIPVMRQRPVATGIVLALGATSLTVGALVTGDDGVPDDAIHAGVPAADAVIDFNRDVRPILVARCFACHGPDVSTRKRGLRLDLREGVVEPAAKGREPVIVPHDAAGSLLLERITDDLDPMPPSGEPLTAEEVEILRRWIDAGAEYEGHWSWEPIQDPTPPTIDDERSATVRNDVDRFVEDRLHAEGLTAAGDATPARQVRRLAFDLTGLPPDPESVEAFERDPSDDHWNRMVETYLASPAFGERWGRHWLDLVRYSETYGHEFDYPIREAWRYRDWVVRAFNQDLGYDRFLAEQIAGDLLDPRPNPVDGTNESVIGTGHWYFHQAVHAPTDVTQDQSDRIADQLEVFGQGFLGLTVACARCHDHKFDAISTRDYYALSGYLQSMHQGYAYLDPHHRITKAAARLRNAGPMRDIRSALESPTRLAEYLKAAAETRPGRTEDGKAWKPVDPERIAEVAGDRDLDPGLLGRWTESFRDDAWRSPDHPWRAWVLLGHDGAIDDESTRRDARGKVVPNIDLVVDEGAVVLESFDQPTPDLRWYPTGWAWTGTDDMPTPRDGTLASDDGDHRLQGTIRSETFTLDRRFLHWRVRGDGNGARIRLVVEGMMMDEFNALLFGGYRRDVASNDGWRHVVNDTRLQAGSRTHLELIDDGTGRLEVDAIWMSDRGDGRLPDEDLPDWIDAARGEDANELAEAFARSAAGSDDSETYRGPLRDRLIDAGLWGDTLAEADANRETVAAEERRRSTIAGDIPGPVRVLAALEGSGVDQHVSIRGSHRSPGEIAVRSFITSIAGEPTSPGPSGSGRLELVETIFATSNPFPARVMANRVWHHLFGRGLVATTDDFGGLGEMPSHPELLDHLASEFRTNWSIKDLIRSIVRSSAYRRSSVPAEATADRMRLIDPNRVLLAAAPVRRLQAEAIRDSMLFTSGRLDSTVGGASVGTHLTPFMNGRGRPGRSGPLDGAGRRSIYLEVRRNFANPMLAAFDLPAPMTTVGRRNSSNVPAQSLVLLNDPFVHEMAAAWADSILADTSLGNDENRARRMWRLAFAAPPTEEDIRIIVDHVDATSDPVEAWNDIAHALYNSKAFVHLD